MGTGSFRMAVLCCNCVSPNLAHLTPTVHPRQRQLIGPHRLPHGRPRSPMLPGSRAVLEIDRGADSRVTAAHNRHN